MFTMNPNVWRKKLRIFFLSLFWVQFFFFSLLVSSYAQVDGLTATVKVSLCGDNIAEGKEHCDGTDTPNNTCVFWGYDGGEILCDPSCYYDFSNCYHDPEEEEPINPDETEAEIILLNPIYQYIIFPTQEDSERTAFLKSFDANNNGLIEADEIPLIVVNWVNAWTHEFDDDFTRSDHVLKICDLNEDSKCDVVDFSMLMFLVNNDELLNY